MLKTVGSFLADAVPILGTVKGVQEVFTGTDYVTGQELSVGDRVATGVGTLVSFVPGGKVVGKTATKSAIDGGSWLIRKFSKKNSADEVLNESIDYRNVQRLQNSRKETLALTKEIRQFKQYWGQYGINVKVDKKGKVLRGELEAGFDYGSGEIWIKKNPSLINLYHEGYHAEQWLAIGKEAYMNLNRLEREEYVFSRVMQNENLFDTPSINHSKEYIDRLRSKYNN
ncbi:zincin-like metallopeptidase toxin domain-containing protein [Paenibacillus nuruki]|uniref:zincin-like metallopeptidase toxin domain-containing protein n=1 Tax=Paenibacillus nuruki TaxID=1886670 RepID=UPI002804F54A|nr:zincin-like metallopeptidase toxin domain-containing protein [Paenibacillus nuruki]CAJ1316691.1 hypothetical protein AASFL403_15805 [Paenibacillus nuruki]